MIRAFLSFLESRGAGEVSRAELSLALAGDGAAGWAALVAEGVIRAGSLATTHACDGLDCAREVREASRAKDGSRRFLAVCTRSPRECETLRVSEAELLEDVIVLDAFVDAVRRALRIEAPLAASPKKALAGADEPRLLGEQIHDGIARDVFFARRPGAPWLRVLLAERRLSPRPTLILVPTARGVDPEMLTRHGAGHVEIVALSDLLVVQKGRIAAASRLRVVPAIAAASERASGAAVARVPASGARRSVVVDRLPRAKRWGEVTIYSLENQGSIGVEIDRRHARFTAAELGLAVARTGEPVRAFLLLRRICDGNGEFDTRPWGGRENGKQVVSELRRALSAAFEIAESPIAAYSLATKSWKVNFVALMAPPKELRELERKMRRE